MSHHARFLLFSAMTPPGDKSCNYQLDGVMHYMS